MPGTTRVAGGRAGCAARHRVSVPHRRGDAAVGPARPVPLGGPAVSRVVVVGGGVIGVACAHYLSRAGAAVTVIDRGDIGEPVVIHHTCRWSIAEDWRNSGTPGWFADPRHVPGGAFIDEGIYWIDYFRWLAGSEVIEVDAKMANAVRERNDSRHGAGFQRRVGPRKGIIVLDACFAGPAQLTCLHE